MRRKSRRTTPQKPSADSLLKYIREITRAINTVKKIANLPGVKSILTSMYGERRHAEQLLAKGYPRKVRRTRTAIQHGARMRKPSPPMDRTTKGEKIARGWRFANAIKQNYGNDPVIAKMTKTQIRSEYRKFRRGLKTRVSDIMWYNPSP